MKEIENNFKKEICFFDIPLLITVFILIGIGIVMVFSSTVQLSVHSKSAGGDVFYFLKRHLTNILVGLFGLTIAMALTKKHFSILSYILPLLSIALLICVLIWGVQSGNAKRWLSIFGLSFQPGEIAKAGFIFYLARFLAIKHTQIKDFFRGLIPLFLTYIVMASLFLLQPDIGSTILLATILAIMIFIAGTKLLYIGGSIILLLISFVSALVFYPDKLTRIIGWLIPWIVSDAEGFQIVQSHITMGDGYIFGTGLGSGLQNIGSFLPEAHTDFIFSVLAEEGGFISVIFLILLFIIILWRGIRIAYNTNDDFVRFLSIGLTLLLIIPAIIHMGVAIGLFPTKGLCLPFISYGGTSMSVSCFIVGVLSRLYRETYYGK